jgi:serine/threonine protein kinase
MHYYLVMEYCCNGTLYDFIRNKKVKSDHQASRLFYQIVSAVKYCHEKGVAHRDLKTLNVLLDIENNIKICDFGLCIYFIGKEKVKTFFGSPCYSSPECLQHVEYDAQKADVWSLGVILYELIVGKLPWCIQHYSKMIQAITTGKFQIPKEIEGNKAQVDLLKGMLHLNPNKRLSLAQVLTNSWVKNGASQKSCIKKVPSSLKQNLSQRDWIFDRNENEKGDRIVSPFNNLKLNAK